MSSLKPASPYERSPPPEPTSTIQKVTADPVGVRESPDTLLGFFDALDLDRAYLQCDWTTRRYTEILVSIAENEEEDAEVRMKAMKILEARAFMGLRACGHLQTVKMLTDSNRDGPTRLVTSQEELRLMRDNSTTTKKMLTEGVSKHGPDPKLIDAKCPETDGEPKAKPGEDSNDGSPCSGDVGALPDDNDPTGIGGDRPPRRPVGGGICQTPGDSPTNKR